VLRLVFQMRWMLEKGAAGSGGSKGDAPGFGSFFGPGNGRQTKDKTKHRRNGDKVVGNTRSLGFRQMEECQMTLKGIDHGVRRLWKRTGVKVVTERDPYRGVSPSGVTSGRL